MRRLPNSAHTSQPWRIHELAYDFRLEDVWAVPTVGGPHDFPGIVRTIASRIRLHPAPMALLMVMTDYEPINGPL